MKKILYTLSALGLVLTMSSCVKEMTFNQKEDKTQYKEITILAHHPGEETKTSLGDGGAVLWSAHDSIKVFYGNQYLSGEYGKCISENTSPASVATFKGYIPDETSPHYDGDVNYYAIYPYDSDTYYSGGHIYYTFKNIQYAVKGSFAEGAFPSVACSSNLEMYFYNVCGGIKITVTQPGVKMITLKSNAGECLAGSGYIYFNEGRPHYYIWEGSASRDELILLSPEGGFEPGEPYYLVVPPVNMTQGFTITFTTDTQSATRVVNKKVVIERSVFSKLTDADKSLTYTNLPSATDFLVGEDGVKYWMWDCSTSYPGCWGNFPKTGNGYASLNQLISYGCSYYESPENIRDTESRFDYMMIDNNGNCISYNEDGIKKCGGRYSVLNYNSSYRSDGWSLGTFSTDEAAILWPHVSDWSKDVFDFDILNLTDDELILAKADSSLWWGTSKGTVPAYYWWRFRSVDKSTFEKGKPTGISLDKTTVVLYQGDEINLTANIIPEDRSFWGVLWSYENLNDNQNTLSQWGLGRYYAQEEGKAVISVKTVGGLTAQCDVEVQKRIPVETFTLSYSRLTLIPDSTFTLTATVLPDSATLKEVVWKSNDTNVATVNENGLVTAVNPGWAQISATTDGGRRTEYCQVYVQNNNVESVSLNKTWLQLYAGDRDTLVATIRPSYAKNKNVEWTSLDETIATVEDGIITAVSVGWTRIVVITEDGGCRCECSVNVLPRSVTGVVLDKTSAEMTVGDQLVLIATVLPENATDKNVVWTSDNSKIATVNKGVVKAVSSGTATITVKTKDGDFTATCALKIRSNGMDPGIGDWEEGESHSGDVE